MNGRAERRGDSTGNGRDPIAVSLLRLGTPGGVVAILIFLLTSAGDFENQLRENCYAARAAITVSADAADDELERRAASRVLRTVNCE